MHDRTRLNYNKANFNQINSDINKKKWQELDNVGSQMSWEIFSKYLSKLVEKNVPIRKLNPRHKIPYIDKETGDAIREKRKKWMK